MLIAKDSFLQKKYEVHINWYWLLSISTFWCYGVGLFPNESEVVKNIILLIFLLFSALAATKFSYRFGVDARTALILGGEELIVLGVAVIYLGIAASSSLNLSLAVDELYHAQASQFISSKISDSLVVRFPELLAWKVKYVWLSVDILLAILFFGTLIGLRRIRWMYLLPIVGLIFLVVRHNLPLMAGVQFDEPHPPLRLFITWLSSTLLGFSNFAFRCPQFLALVGCSFLTFRIFRKTVSFLPALAGALSVATIPLVLHCGTILEFSIWTAFALLFLIFEIVYVEPSISPELRGNLFLSCVSIVSIISLIRQPTFVLLLPLVGFVIVRTIQIKPRHAIPYLICILSPVLLPFPFLIKSMMVGTPATYMPAEVFAFMPSHMSAIDRLSFAISSGTIYGVVTRQLGNIWPIFILVFFIWLFKTYTRHILRNTWLLGTFCILVITFYIIRPALWGVGRYQVEFIIPFLILGFSFILNIDFKSFEFLKTAVLLVVGGLNLWGYNSLLKSPVERNPNDSRMQWPVVISKEYYNWDVAITEIKKSGYAKNFIFKGTTYGPMPLILNGFTYDELISYLALEKKLGPDQDFTQNATSDPQVQMVLLAVDGELLGKKIDPKDFLKNGWSVWNEFGNINPSHPLLALIKN